VQLMS